MLEAHPLSEELLLTRQAWGRGVGTVGRHARPGLGWASGEMGRVAEGGASEPAGVGPTAGHRQEASLATTWLIPLPRSILGSGAETRGLFQEGFGGGEQRNLGWLSLSLQPTWA